MDAANHISFQVRLIVRARDMLDTARRLIRDAQCAGDRAIRMQLLRKAQTAMSLARAFYGEVSRARSIRLTHHAIRGRGGKWRAEIRIDGSRGGWLYRSMPSYAHRQSAQRAAARLIARKYSAAAAQ